MSLLNFAAWQDESITSSTEPAQKKHCFRCFNELFSALQPREAGKANAEEGSQQIDQELAKFIGSDELLRGCIGNFSPSPVRDGLKEYALISFEDCKSVYDWSIGKHGLYIHIPDPDYHPLPIDNLPNSESSRSREVEETPVRFGIPHEAPAAITATRSEASTPRNSPRMSLGKRSKRMLSATYLPDVASEQGWTKLETIDSAIRKAGWDGPITQALRDTLVIERYQSSKCTVTYEEWAEWRARMGCGV